MSEQQQVLGLEEYWQHSVKKAKCFKQVGELLVFSDWLKILDVDPEIDLNHDLRMQNQLLKAFTSARQFMTVDGEAEVRWRAKGKSWLNHYQKTASILVYKESLQCQCAAIFFKSQVPQILGVKDHLNLKSKNNLNLMYTLLGFLLETKHCLMLSNQIN